MDTFAGVERTEYVGIQHGCQPVQLRVDGSAVWEFVKVVVAEEGGVLAFVDVVNRDNVFGAGNQGHIRSVHKKTESVVEAVLYKPIVLFRAEDIVEAKLRGAGVHGEVEKECICVLGFSVGNLVKVGVTGVNNVVGAGPAFALRFRLIRPNDVGRIAGGEDNPTIEPGSEDVWPGGREQALLCAAGVALPNQRRGADLGQTGPKNCRQKLAAVGGTCDLQAIRQVRLLGVCGLRERKTGGGGEAKKGPELFCGRARQDNACGFYG